MLCHSKISKTVLNKQTTNSDIWFCKTLNFHLFLLSTGAVMGIGVVFFVLYSINSLLIASISHLSKSPYRSEQGLPQF